MVQERASMRKDVPGCKFCYGATAKFPANAIQSYCSVIQCDFRAFGLRKVSKVTFLELVRRECVGLCGCVDWFGLAVEQPGSAPRQ